MAFDRSIARSPDFGSPVNEDSPASSPVRRRGRRRLISVVLLAAFSYVTLVGLLLIPDHILFQQRLLFSVLDLDVEAPLQPLDYETHDGQTLRSWYMAPDEDHPVIVYFAGRDGDILRKPRHLFPLTERGYGLLLVGYRGYGGNPGFPNEPQMYIDNYGLLSQVRSSGMAENGFILYGYSMGTGFAANAATQIAPVGVILEAPMSSFLDSVRQQAGQVPAFLVRTRFDNLAKIAEIRAPTLLLAGGMDSVTPAWFALSLAAVNQTYATVKVFEDANHFNIMRLGGSDAITNFLDDLDTGGERTGGSPEA